MADLLAALGWIVLGLVAGSFLTVMIAVRVFQFPILWFVRLFLKEEEDADKAGQHALVQMLKEHFGEFTSDALTITERTFPYRSRPDLQRALEQLPDRQIKIEYFSGVTRRYYETPSFTACLESDEQSPMKLSPPQYDEFDIGEEEPMRCLKMGLWLLEKNRVRFAVVVAPANPVQDSSDMMVQVAALKGPEGNEVTKDFFAHLEAVVKEAVSYRGKILSLEQDDNYSGTTGGIKVHKLRRVERDQVILPKKTLDLLDRNVIGFVKQREKLARFGQSTKKGLLFYGPPGTGKTHTIHYLTRSLEGHTTLLITAEQVGQLPHYMTLARLLQPSIVVLEDVDLIGRDRGQMTTCEEVVLNQLLNEMDGLREGADILFILTTNRPEALEQALASRPGRIDQAIEFPLPDEEGRAKLVRLYAQGLPISDDVVNHIVQRTGRVTAAFIKELMRRSVQFHIERDGEGQLDLSDVDQALDEMLYSGGPLSLKLLGAAGNSTVDGNDAVDGNGQGLATVMNRA